MTLLTDRVVQFPVNKGAIKLLDRIKRRPVDKPRVITVINVLRLELPVTFKGVTVRRTDLIVRARGSPGPDVDMVFNTSKELFKILNIFVKGAKNQATVTGNPRHLFQVTGRLVEVFRVALAIGHPHQIPGGIK